MFSDGILMRKQFSSSHNQVVRMGSLVQYNKVAHVVTGWSKTDNLVYIAREKTVFPVVPSEIKLRWSEDQCG